MSPEESDQREAGGGQEAQAAAEAERWLASLDPIGWRFGLDRIEALVTELGHPQRRFASAHVVGTNGKSSVVAMTAALLEAAGTASGAYLSPHTERWSQRIVIRGREVEPDAFADAASRVARACEAVEPRLPAGERVTQFEAATAVAFVALAEAGVEVGVIEAGLGGRLDATNVLPSRATALTSIGLDHTAWLGETPLEIAGEKLAVLRPGSTLVVGRLEPEVLALARRTAAEHGAELVIATEADRHAPATSEAPYLHRNLGVAVALARAMGATVDEATVARAMAQLRLRGRSEWVAGDPPLVLDAAHNPDGAEALAEALAARRAGPVVACLAVLADKDAEGIVAALAPELGEAFCCEIPAHELEGSGRPGSQAVPAGELARLCERHRLAARACEGPEEAVVAAVARARELGGVALIAGSHYLLRYEWIARHAQSSSR